MHISTAVRVRPFLPFERTPVLCVRMSPHELSIQPLSAPPLSFLTGLSIWSHDPSPPDPGLIFTDNQGLYSQLGSEMVAYAQISVDSCLITYGGNATGKTHSILGTATDPGLVYTIADGLLLNLNQNDGLTFSMIEIYMEKVNDLLSDFRTWPISGLKIRENRPNGFRIDGITEEPVTTASDIHRLISIGLQNWAKFSTTMSVMSKSAHLIYEFKLVRQSVDDVGVHYNETRVTLGDLAGCERVGMFNASKNRMKESVSINRSLSTLRNCLIQLISRTKSGSKPVHIPYRDSALTRILRNGLEGQGKMTILATISPDLGSWEETVGTLRLVSRIAFMRCEGGKVKDEGRMIEIGETSRLGGEDRVE